MLRTTAVWSAGPGTPFYTTLYFGGDTAGEAAFARSAARDFLLLWMPSVNNGYGGVVLGDVERVDALTGNIVEVFSAADIAFNGASAGEVVPFTTQLLIRWRTGDYVNGREIRGRTFIPGTLETVSSNGAPAGSFVVTSNINITAWLGDADTVGAGGFIIYSPTHRQPAAVSGGTLWNQFAVLRTRRP